MKRCLGCTRISKTLVEWCQEPATLECIYGDSFAGRHYRCDKHPPLAGWFAFVRPIGDRQLSLFAGAR